MTIDKPECEHIDIITKASADYMKTAEAKGISTVSSSAGLCKAGKKCFDKCGVIQAACRAYIRSMLQKEFPHIDYSDEVQVINV